MLALINSIYESNCIFLLILETDNCCNFVCFTTIYLAVISMGTYYLFN